MPTIEACLRTFDHYGNRDNKIRARMKWLVDTMGIDELRERVDPRAQVPPRRAGLAGWTARRGRARRRRAGRRHPGRAAGGAVGRDAGPAAEVGSVRTVGRGQRRPRRGARHHLGVRVRPPRRHHDRAVPAARRHPARLRARRPHHQPAELRAARCHRSRPARPLRPAVGDLDGRARRRARTRRRVVPGCRHLQPRSDAVARPCLRHRRRARRSGPGRGRRRARQHLRLHEQLRAAPHLRHRLHGPRTARPRTRRARIPDAPRWTARRDGSGVRSQGRQVAGQDRARGRRADRRPVRGRARSRRDVLDVARAVRRRQGCRSTVSPPSTTTPRPDEAPEYYVDYDETGPYVAEVGASECAT